VRVIKLSFAHPLEPNQILTEFLPIEDRGEYQTLPGCQPSLFDHLRLMHGVEGAEYRGLVD
jgi:hypothetical protein